MFKFPLQKRNNFDNVILTKKTNTTDGSRRINIFKSMLCIIAKKVLFSLVTWIFYPARSMRTGFFLEDFAIGKM